MIRGIATLRLQIVFSSTFIIGEAFERIAVIIIQRHNDIANPFLYAFFNDDQVSVVDASQIHDADSGFAGHGIQALFSAFGTGVQAKLLGDGRSRDVRVQNGGPIPRPLSHNGHQGGDEALADTALAADDADDFFDVAAVM